MTMPETPVPELAQYDVTCHTAECGNAEHVIRVLATETDPYIVCGPCGQLITDLEPVE